MLRGKLGYLKVSKTHFLNKFYIWNLYNFIFFPSKVVQAKDHIYMAQVKDRESKGQCWPALHQKQAGCPRFLLHQNANSSPSPTLGRLVQPDHHPKLFIRDVFYHAFFS